MLVSNYSEYFKLSSYLRERPQPIGLVMGLNNLADIFKEEYYSAWTENPGSLRVLFKDNVKIYAYPIDHENFERYRKQIGQGDNVEAEINEDGLVTVENLMVAQNLRNLYKYVRENGFLEDLNNCSGLISPLLP